MNNLRITIIQSDIAWHNINKNLEHIESVIKNIKNPADLIILPEMFTTGFTMNPAQVSETMNGSAVSFLRQIAGECKCDITGSVVINENSMYYNRLVWAKPDGSICTYDKRHLFRMAGEEKIYSPGTGLLTVELKGWKIRPFICYDLRFPVWSRNAGMEYDLAVYSANWPAKREFHWNMLLQARAIENQCYVAGVNRAGVDGNDVAYSGGSAVINFGGKIIARCGNRECIETVELSRAELLSYRESFPAWKDCDKFKLLQV